MASTLPRAFSTFLSAEPLEGVGLGQARVRDDPGAQLDGQTDGLVALGQFTIVEESQELGESHLQWKRLTWKMGS